MRWKQSLVPMVGLLLIGSAAIAKTNGVGQGHVLYVALCASCHGTSGQGDGPAASALSTRPSNLRLLSVRYGNPLPADQIAQFIDGRVDVKAHGPRDMPVWGKSAWAKPEGKNGPSEIKSWVAKVVAYLESIQKP
jgi:mono/diheme cytochrome c family protein